MYKRLSTLIAFTCLSLAAAPAPICASDWAQERALGQDVSVSHGGEKWHIGQDGKAYHWRASAWQQHGSRNDFIRIDAGDAGAAALSKSGYLYLSDKNTATWTPTGIYARDVGIGGGKIWLAGAKDAKGRVTTLYADFSLSEALDWRAVKGALSALDVDPAGRAWGADAAGKLYVHTDEKGWIEDTLAPKTSDVGIGGNGALFVVGQDKDSALGGGRVYQRDPESGAWQEMTGRLEAITVTPSGQAFGANSLHWMIASNRDAASGGNNLRVEPPEIDKDIVVQGDKTLADIVGDKIPGANKVKLTGYKFTANPETAEGWVELNGSPVHAVLYTEQLEKPIIALEHASVDLGTYIAKLRETPLGSFGLMNAIFFILPDQTGDVDYASLADVPQPLQGVFKKGDYQSLFPLQLKPGVNVIGTYSPSSDANAAHVMKAFNLSQTGYAVKGHFTVEQLKNPSLSFKRRTSKAGSELKIDKKELCNAAVGAVPLSGLDLSFPLPNYSPTYAGNALSFHDARFTLKEIDGNIEPAIIAGIDFKLDKARAGISSLQMAGKLAVEGNLNIVCSGISTQTEGKISLAAATSFNAAEIKDIAFDTLGKLIETGHVKAEKEQKAAPEDKDKSEKKKQPKWGWENPFGAPFMTLHSFAVNGVFQQQEKEGALERSLALTSYSHATLDRAEIEAQGKLDFDIKQGGSVLEISDWGFHIPSTVALNDLPIVKDTPYLDEFTFGQIDVTPQEMVGTLGWGAQRLSGKAYLHIADAKGQKGSFVGRIDTLKPSHLLLPYMRDVSFPDFVENAALSPAIISFDNEGRKEWSLGTMPEKAKPLFDGLLNNGETLTLANGLTLAGITSPAKIFSGKYGDVVTKHISFGDSLMLKGAFERDKEKQRVNVALSAALNNFALKEIPETILDFKDSTLSFSDLESPILEISTDADLKLPFLGAPLSLTGSVKIEAPNENASSINVKLASTGTWDKPLNIPEFKIENIGFEAAFARNGENRTQSAAIVGDGTLRAQTGRAALITDFKDGTLDDALFSFDGSLKVSELLKELPAAYSSVADLTLSKLLISKNAVAGDMTLQLGEKSIAGRGAIIMDDADHALFIRNDHQIKVSDIVKNVPVPLNGLTLPKGVFIIASKAASDFDAHDIPTQIYDEIFEGLVDDERIQKLNIADGLMYLTLIDVDTLPEMIKPVLKTTFGLKGEVPVAASFGGIFGGEPSFGFYTSIKDAAPSWPDFIDPFIEFKNANLDIFVQSVSGGRAVEIGISSDAWVKARRLDKPSEIQNLDTTLSLTYSVSEGNTAILAGAAIKGEWEDPLGLEGYSLNKPSLKFGQKANGTTLQIHTERATFTEGGKTKAFLFDLDTTWAGAVPTDLAVQLANVCEGKETTPGAEENAPCEDLVLSPISLARVQKSIFDLAFRSGSNLKDAIIAGLKEAPIENAGQSAEEQEAITTVKNNAATLINGFADGLNAASDGMFSLVENSPLSMIGVKNPVIYFGTPGSTPPQHPDVERPPLGFGLHVGGEFMVGIGDLDTPLAQGIYKVNLVDGYHVRGSVRAPDPFSSVYMDVSGNMPILGGPQFLRFSGNLEIPGAEVFGISLGADGHFDVTRGALSEQKAGIAADISIGGVLSRQVSMQLDGTRLTFSSPSECTDIPPLDIKGSLSLQNMTSAGVTKDIVSAFLPVVPDPVSCAQDIAEAFKNIAEGVYAGGQALINDPEGALGSLGEGLIDEGAELITDPGATLEKAKNLAQMPADTAEALAGAGISLVKMGVEQIPVLGPGAGRMIGEGFNKANELKNMAMNALTNNELTGWMSDSFGAAAGSIANAAKDAANQVGSYLGWGDDSEPPKWYGVNPLKCGAGQHYWNPVFKQCFENGSIVLFDEASRIGGKLGDCMVFDHAKPDSLRVDICGGTGFNQLHLNSATDQIETSASAYNGYKETFMGPGSMCLVRYGNTVILDSCHKNVDKTKWSYTEDMKLKNGDKCMTRNSINRVVMGGCDTATKWLGTSIVPNWNQVEGIAPRGEIRHAQSNTCLFWTSRGPQQSPDPYALQDCSGGSDPDYYYRYSTNHAQIQVLDQNHTVALNGAAPWGGWDIYGCIGLVGPNSDNVMARHCWPHLIYEESKWKIYAVINGALDKSNAIPLKDILAKHEYVFENLHSGKCLSTGSYSRPASALLGSISPSTDQTYLSKVESCTGLLGKVKAQVKFRGYAPDSLAQLALDKAAQKEQREWRAARYKMLDNLQQWQRYRVRAENAHIDEVRKMASAMGSNIREIQRDRQSPGRCAHNEYWNQTLKICAKNSRMLLKYHSADGTLQGCLQETSDYYGARIKNSCNIDNEAEAIINTMAFFFDDQGRIVKKNAEFRANIQRAADGFYYDMGNTKIEGSDTCLIQNRSVVKLEGQMPVDFGSCSSSTAKWKFSPQGELVSPEGKCLRNYHYEKKAYNRSNVRIVDNLVKDDARLKEMSAHLTAQKALVIKEKEVYRKQHGLQMKDQRVADEYYRLYAHYRIDELGAEIISYRNDLRKQLALQYPTYVVSPHSNMALVDCAEDPMEMGRFRWIPTIGYDFSAKQSLPKTARIQLAANDNLCMGGNLYLDGDIELLPCAAENKNQYFAFGGTDESRFLISPRNSKTCLYDAGNGEVAHRACRSNGAEMFMQIDAGAGTVKLQNALSGQCLSEGNGKIIQADCDNASTFKFDEVENIDQITFELDGALLPNIEKTAAAQQIWQTAEKRATLMYMGAYLGQGGAILQKDDADEAVVLPPSEQIPLERLLSHIDKDGNVVYIPAVNAPKTQILSLPGFEYGADHITFAHARRVLFNDKPTREHVTDPYVANFADWFLWAHYQKVLNVDENGVIKFSYITEDEDFRKAATFKMRPVGNADEQKFSFESLAQRGKYLTLSNGKLILTAQPSALTLESTAKWFKNAELNLSTMEPPLRAPKPPYKGWKFPDTPTSILNKDY